MTNEAGQVTAQLLVALALCSSHCLLGCFAGWLLGCLAADWEGGTGPGWERSGSERDRDWGLIGSRPPKEPEAGAEADWQTVCGTSHHT